MVVILKVILKCLQCCVACFEKFMKFININAYIETGRNFQFVDNHKYLFLAIYGYNFCRAAMKAFQLLVRLIFNYHGVESFNDNLIFIINQNQEEKLDPRPCPN